LTGAAVIPHASVGGFLSATINADWRTVHYSQELFSTVFQISVHGFVTVREAIGKRDAAAQISRWSSESGMLMYYR
jgi:hypothetical protein